MSNYFDSTDTKYVKTYASIINAQKAMEHFNDTVRYTVTPCDNNRFRVIVLNAGDYGVGIAHAGHLMVGW